MSSFTHVTKATRIPVPGGKLIEELFGRVNTGDENISIAHMVAPSGWSEPAQKPEFDEYTLMVRGRMRVQVGEETVDIAAGEAIRTPAGERVHYSNPFDEENEYFAICLPAFELGLAHRED
jgi:mannose-6-phosphate isomerase-like protein (cupin superfamily)